MKTPYAKFIGTMLFAVGVLSVSFTHAQQAATTSDDLKWVKGPASLPAGAKLAILKGDFAKPGTLAYRLKLPAGYQLMPQSSPAINRIVVVSGTFYLGAGEKFDRARTIPMSTGYVHWLDESPYFAWTKEETVIEIDGVGPWSVSYVNPGDNPMKRK